MIYTKKLPQIKICMDVKKYNILLELISQGVNNEDKAIKEKSLKMKNKLLRFSVPIENNTENTEIKSLFYIDEITDILEIILITTKTQATENYYDSLLKLRSNN